MFSHISKPLYNVQHLTYSIKWHVWFNDSLQTRRHHGHQHRAPPSMQAIEWCRLGNRVGESSVSNMVGHIFLEHTLLVLCN